MFLNQKYSLVQGLYSSLFSRTLIILSEPILDVIIKILNFPMDRYGLLVMWEQVKYIIE